MQRFRRPVQKCDLQQPAIRSKKWVRDFGRLESTAWRWWTRLSQMEPTDQLDASNRRLPESRVGRFAKRKPASRPSSIVLVTPSVVSTSQIERVGCCWLRTRGFGASQGQSWGQCASSRRGTLVKSSPALRSDPAPVHVAEHDGWRLLSRRHERIMPDENTQAMS
jgi:hypothetical protein